MYFGTQFQHSFKKDKAYRQSLDCVFCKIIEGKIKAKVIAETDKSLAFLDAFPLAKGHTLVIPKKHHQKIQDMSQDESRDVFELVHKVLPKVDAVSGSTLVAAHNGRDAGQEVPHVHIHLVPRSKGDSAGPIHSMFSDRPHLSEEEFDQVLDALR